MEITATTPSGTISTKVEMGAYNRVRENRSKTGVSIQKFFSQAAEEKLDRDSKKEKAWDYLCKKLKEAGVQDNNYTARLIYEYFH